MTYIVLLTSVLSSQRSARWLRLRVRVRLSVWGSGPKFPPCTASMGEQNFDTIETSKHKPLRFILKGSAVPCVQVIRTCRKAMKLKAKYSQPVHLVLKPNNDTLGGISQWPNFDGRVCTEVRGHKGKQGLRVGYLL